MKTLGLTSNSFSMNKHSELLALAKLRQASWWPGYTTIADYHDGI
jgi:hypothetical protein